jgi:hypothetical protein
MISISIFPVCQPDGYKSAGKTKDINNAISRDEEF